ncbi:VRR-NUC domain-containing protein [Simiduia sp. 21SJ11W-1]|uniref:VRR-NUC domain-containing protein n=1 Tax=Simiduia sp. 21SJ11W-1 TaxID=2909669 RepID=UPI00209F37AC|nr:VRR-NUC domain-containing protein [Simiduia sp. 21SJ11W-1]UTA47194.1 VRR-NUC domain-containing protein [Simiduia sp. 21SJ11W-1]
MAPEHSPPPRYYLENYQRLIGWVAERYGDLLKPAEKAYACTFSQLPENAQALLVRMITRKGAVFRTAKLHYAEIGDAEQALAKLPDAWVEHDPQLSLDALFKLLTKAELANWLGAFTGTKAQKLCELQAQHPCALPLSQWQQEFGAVPISDRLLAITIMDISDTYQWLFFGNRHQSLAEFVLSDLGIMRYETVAFSENCRSFDSREALECYQTLAALAEGFEQGVSASELLAGLKQLVRPKALHLARRYDRLAYKCAYKLEQQGLWEAALEGYRLTQLPMARTRTIRVLEKQGQQARAYELWQSAHAAPLDEAERQQLQRMQPRLARALGKAPMAKAKPNWPTQTLILPPREMRVELLVAEAMSNNNQQALWSENWLWTSLFGLVMWPALYAPVPGAFFHPFQSAPKDINLPRFYERRQALFDACLDDLARPDICALLTRRLQEKQGIASHFVHWPRFDEACLAQALKAIGPHILRKVFERMLFDLPANRAGFPDLIVYQHAGFSLLEVKGPGDSLQENQKRWLHFFNGLGVDASVVQVQWASNE